MSKTESAVVQVAAKTLDFYTRAAERDIAEARSMIADLRKCLTGMLKTLDITEDRLAGKYNSPDFAKTTPRDKTFILRAGADSVKNDALKVAGLAARMNEKAYGAHAVLDALAEIQSSSMKQSPAVRRPE